MSDEADDLEEGDEEGGAKKTSGKKLVLFVALPVLILLGAGAGLYFSGMLDSLLGAENQSEEMAEEEIEQPFVPGAYVQMDEMLVSLRSTGAKQKFLKIQLSLELDSEADRVSVEDAEPRIIDNFQVFLRELRLEELEGSQGVYRIKEELLDRVNQAVHPIKIKDVLFKDMLIQ